MSLSPELEALKNRALAASTCDQWAAQLGWVLRRSGGELTGPCPICGGTDRFSINIWMNVWNCRGCQVGGDVIRLVMHTEHLKFDEACLRVTGESGDYRPDPVEAARLEQKRLADEAQREQEAANYRERARKDAHHIWDKAQPPYAATLEAYLQLRGLDGGSIALGEKLWADGMPLRYAPLRAYWHNGQLIYSGPAMIAAIQMPNRHFGGVHQTWIDLDAPKGKLALPPVDGKDLPAKKVLGIKKGGAIRLFTPPAASRLVMGEGVETTLTAMAHAREANTAYWAGIDLGNMSGKAARKASGGLVHDQPDMLDRECFLPPDWVEELVYICDGDEPEKHTVDKVRRGLRRAKRLRDAARADGVNASPLSIRMVPPGAEGTDLNTLAMAGAADVGDDEQGEQ